MRPASTSRPKRPPSRPSPRSAGGGSLALPGTDAHRAVTRAARSTPPLCRCPVSRADESERLAVAWQNDAIFAERSAQYHHREEIGDGEERRCLKPRARRRRAITEGDCRHDITCDLEVATRARADFLDSLRSAVSNHVYTTKHNPSIDQNFHALRHAILRSFGSLSFKYLCLFKLGVRTAFPNGGYESALRRTGHRFGAKERGKTKVWSRGRSQSDRARL